MANNYRNAGRKPIMGGKSRHIVATAEEFTEIKKLLLEIRTKAKENESRI